MVTPRIWVALTFIIGAWRVVVKTRRARRVIIPPGVVSRVMVMAMIRWSLVLVRLCVLAPVEVVVGFLSPVNVMVNLGRWGWSTRASMGGSGSCIGRRDVHRGNRIITMGVRHISCGSGNRIGWRRTRSCIGRRDVQSGSQIITGCIRRGGGYCIHWGHTRSTSPSLD